MADKIKLTIEETVEANTVTIVTQTTTVNVAEFLNLSGATVVATGTVINLSFKDSEYNQAAPLTDLVYTFTGSTVGNFAKVSIPTGLASYPTITGASLIESPTFDTSRKSYMILEYTSSGAEYFFIHR